MPSGSAAATPSRRQLAELRLRRSRGLLLAGLAALTAGLTAAVSHVVPGRHSRAGYAPAGDSADPFSQPLQAFPPTGAQPAPGSTSQAPVALSGSS